MPLVRDLIYFIVALVVSPILIFRLLLTGKWRTDWASRFGRCSIRQDDRPVVMIHAVSLGEVNAIRFVVDQLVSKSNQKVRIVISVTTDTIIPAVASDRPSSRCKAGTNGGTMPSWPADSTTMP